MNDATRKLLTTEAARKLRSYLATGIAGFLAQGVDRVRELGITVTTYLAAGDRAEVEHMALMLEIGWAY